MYLKSLELNGFKSFADRTLLQFEPGLTAIVGPNGCGKSNLADAVRWVLGEQSAKALRGAKMEDCIFNGTDARKPFGMAEVSMTFAECEALLGTDYHEVTVTRRVFRSGEGQYFLNKTPCRLKDIQRLFMDTGVGTAAYSLMEQGRIDQVLSSHPEDRREIFEEASGITKFKTDRKEALRKLEQTEANLLRLSDVIREVKRQIGSLQRQAGKARRYKELRERLRELDLFATGGRLQEMERELRAQESAINDLTVRIQRATEEAQVAANLEAERRAALLDAEHAIAETMEARGDAEHRLERARDLIRVNGERVGELRRLEERDARDAEEARLQLDQQNQELAIAEARLESLKGDRAAADQAWQEAAAALAAVEADINRVREEIAALRAEAMAEEDAAARIQNQLAHVETQERAAAIQRERLLAEHANLQSVVADYDQRQAALAAQIQSLAALVEERRRAVQEAESRRNERADRIAALRAADADAQARAADLKGRLQVLLEDEQAGQGFAAGARALLDPSNPLNLPSDAVIGPLADQLDVGPEYRKAVEAVLRAWLDAVVLRSPADALTAIQRMTDSGSGSARMLAASQAVSHETSGPGEPLHIHIRYADALAPAIATLLGNVRLINSIEELPASLPDNVVLVTRSGVVVRPGGLFERWAGDLPETNPLTRKHTMADLRQQAAAIDDQRAALKQEWAALETEQDRAKRQIEECVAALDQARRDLAVCEGEMQVVSHEAELARRRIETVAWELGQLPAPSGEQRSEMARQLSRHQARQGDIRRALESLSARMQELEQKRAGLYHDVSERRISLAATQQETEAVRSTQERIRRRIAELEALIRSREEAQQSYTAAMEQLAAERLAAENNLPDLERSAQAHAERLERLRQGRAERAADLATAEARLAALRKETDAMREERGRLEVVHAETRMRHDTLAQTTASAYDVRIEDLTAPREPVWDGEPLAGEALDAAIADLRSRIEALGPVNLVAIEEYSELEERHDFLARQQDDLVRAKQQLTDLIRRINQTTAELFSATFARINENFQIMFQRLFNGGTARLTLLDEQDVLESGIEIVARPPGKRLQSVSLLSGGERTLTAVALLFAIYMIKPSPFCMLDELDAALDDSNIGRFIAVLQDFLSQTQFIVITHNRRTIAAAGTIYGVTTPEQGISKVVSMKFKEYEAREREFSERRP